MLFTIAHELTHFIRQNSPAKFDALADIVVNKSNLKGKIPERIEQKMREAEDRGEPISRDTAYEEVIADSMETILTSGRVLEMMNEVKKQDKTLWERSGIGSWISSRVSGKPIRVWMLILWKARQLLRWTMSSRNWSMSLRKA